MEKLVFMVTVLLAVGFFSFIVVMLIYLIKRFRSIKDHVEHEQPMFWNTQLQEEIDNYENRR